MPDVMFEPGVSIALIGLPGVGKSTLGVIASTSLKMRLVETDRCFRTMTGLTASEYVGKFGRQSCLQKSEDVLRHILQKHSSNCIIAVATRMSDIPGCRSLLQDFSASHPLIHVVRAPEALVSHMEGHMSKQDVLQMYDRTLPHLRALANFEFHGGGFRGQQNGLGALKATGGLPSFLSLKHMQRDFLGFLRFINGKKRHSSFLLPPEEADFSRILLVPFPHQDADLPDLGGIYGVHAIQIVLTLKSLSTSEWFALTNRMSAVSAIFRSGCDFPLAFRVELPQTAALRSAIFDESRYFNALSHAVALGFDYCYLDLRAPLKSTQSFMKRRSTTKIIGTWHNDSASSTTESRSWWRSAECYSIYEMAVDLGCAVVQLSTKASSVQENFDTTHFRGSVTSSGSEAVLRVCAFNTGEIGKFSRILNRTLTPVVTPDLLAGPCYASDHQVPELQGIITTEQCQKALEAAFVVRRLRFCSFGSVISHSVAPAMHNAALAALGLPHHYGVMESADLQKSLSFMGSVDFGGLSCANPHKRSMIPLLDHVSEEARDIRAVNTVYPVSSAADGRTLLYGENTDWIGVTSCVRNYLSLMNTVTSKTTALVIGAGGMAHAAVYALLRMGLTKIFVWNRTIEKAEELADHFHKVRKTLRRDRTSPTGSLESASDLITVLQTVDTTGLFEDGTPPPTIIINGLADGNETPVAAAFDLPCQWFAHPTGGVYIEAAYKKRNSVLMKKVGELMSRNWIAVGGPELLLEQAFPQIELWTGMMAPRDVMRQAVGL